MSSMNWLRLGFSTADAKLSGCAKIESKRNVGVDKDSKHIFYMRIKSFRGNLKALFRMSILSRQS